jgi:dCMP deaminase
MSKTRPSWDSYFLRIADAASERSTCLRRSVGAVLVRDRRILATGYNGAPEGLPHCLDVGCLMVDGHCVRTLHAEQNALLQAAAHGVSTQGATVYVTSEPCFHCTKMLLNARVQRIVYRDPYDDALARAMRAEAGILCERVEESAVDESSTGKDDNDHGRHEAGSPSEA